MLTAQLLSKEKKISVIGLGYVGLPIALEFAKKVQVIGFDINEKRIATMQQNMDPSNELAASDFDNSDVEFTSLPARLREAHFHIIAVPTPIDAYNKPDLKPLFGACVAVGKALKKGDYVVFESTVYPGCTEEDCVPILERESGLKLGTDFKVGFSPERINPGDKVHTLTNILKITSGSDAEAAENIAQTYELIIKAGVHRASSIKVAESAKIIENTQRDVNIALMNELSLIFDRLDINSYEVLEAAGTKWNFLKFFPGLVGGHCIGVDPYYLVHKAHQIGYHPQIIAAGRAVNDSMGYHIAKVTVKKLTKRQLILGNARVLVMGITFKENVSDIRNTKVVDLIREMQDFMVSVDVIDPHANAHEVAQEYKLTLKSEPDGNYDAVIVAVNHHQYQQLTADDFRKYMGNDGILIDIKGIYRHLKNEFDYWSL
jgi:UDP-N-acetyl-D-galactosamine dehydrogenase